MQRTRIEIRRQRKINKLATGVFYVALAVAAVPTCLFVAGLGLIAGGARLEPADMYFLADSAVIGIPALVTALAAAAVEVWTRW